MCKHARCDFLKQKKLRLYLIRMPVPLTNNNVDPLTSTFEEVRSRVRQNSLRRRTLTSGSGSGSGRVAEEESDTEVRSHERTRQKKFCKYFKELQGEFVTESKKGSKFLVLNIYFFLLGIACAFVGDILLQGHLYVTDNYLAFHSNVFGYVTKVDLLGWIIFLNTPYDLISVRNFPFLGQEHHQGENCHDHSQRCGRQHRRGEVHVHLLPVQRPRLWSHDPGLEQSLAQE